MAKNKRLFIDMCAGSELKDTQGETLSVEGADISELENGNGRLNDNHGKGFFNSIGRVTTAKKIFKAEDCDNERQKYYWEKIKAPYIYVAGELYNDEDHPNAKAAAAILRNIHRADVPLKMKASVEGGVISRGINDPSRLARTKIHSVALTFTPANNATLVEPINLDKSNIDWEADAQLIKSVMHLSETNVPSFRHIERHASASTIIDNINKIQELAKTVGLDIQVSPMSPEQVMKQAAVYKVHNNLKKINEMIKAIGSDGLPVKPKFVPSARAKAREAHQDNIRQKMDNFEQNMGQIKQDAEMAPNPVNVVRNKPIEQNVPDTMQIKNAAKVKQENTLQMHANKAMNNIAHLKDVHSDLISRGIHPDKAQAVVNKIRSYMDIKKSEQYDKARNNMLKALTAGFGGAGAPTDLTGGGVFQTESIEDGRKKDSIKYISCDNCGDEQVYMKHQVKCRKCGSNYSLDKLNKFM